MSRVSLDSGCFEAHRETYVREQTKRDCCFRKKLREKRSISDKNYERKGGSEEAYFRLHKNMKLLVLKSKGK